MLYSFDGYELDTERYELRLEGEEVHIEPQVFNFLQFLIENKDRVVSRDEIIEKIWQGRIVSDTTVSSCVKSARKILGDDGEHQKYIKTTRGRGFQFITDIRTVGKISQNSHTEQKKLITSHLNKSAAGYVIIAGLIFIIGLLLYNQNNNTPASNINSYNDYTIAVMPFVDLSSEKNQEYFGDGISEEVLNMLTTIDQLNVTSRTTAFSLKGQQLPIPEIAERLNVNYIVEGSVRHSNGRIRITAQLIDTRNDSQLWSENYDRELTDIFSIQDDISQKIVTALELEIIGNSQSSNVPTRNMEAYTLYLQGHQLFLNRGIGDLNANINNLETAITFLEQAVEIDPNFAEAWADLATSLIILPSYFDKKYSFDIVSTSATTAANKAISLKPTLSQAWAVKGFIHLNKLEFQESEAAINHATVLNSNNETAWFWRGLHYLAVGSQNKAIEAIENAIRISPNVPIYHSGLGMAQHAKGNIDQAINHMDKAIDEMGFEAGRLDRAIIAMWNNNIESARNDMAEFSITSNQLDTDDWSQKINSYINAFGSQSEKEPAKKILLKDIKAERENTFGLYMMQDSELFIADFDKTPVNKGFVLSRIYNPIARPFFKNKSYREFIKKIGLYTYWKNNSFPYFCYELDADDFACG